LRSSSIAALVLYLTVLVTLAAVRILIQQRRTGDSGNRLAAATIGSPQWWSVLIAAVGVAAVGLAAVADLAGLPRVGYLDHPIVKIIGSVLVVGGASASLIAELAMGDSWRIGVDSDERTALVVHGPFRLVRNPIFTAGLTALGGLALMVPNALAVAGLATSLVGFELQVRTVEEPYLIRAHGIGYLRYASRTGRFIPGLGRLHDSRPVRTLLERHDGKI
jgi:protein-S-isoprenylcysteine O-methyltransferase Ste14